METVGERLKWARTQAGFDTIARASERCSFHKQNLADHEADRRGVSVENAKDYSKAFKIDAWWLLTGEGEVDLKRSSQSNTVNAIATQASDFENVVSQILICCLSIALNKLPSVTKMQIWNVAKVLAFVASDDRLALKDRQDQTLESFHEALQRFVQEAEDSHISEADLEVVAKRGVELLFLERTLIEKFDIEQRLAASE
ncbi:MAG: helix-turn-helix transcriptional regulator [Pseudomonadota bacterium]